MNQGCRGSVELRKTNNDAEIIEVVGLVNSVAFQKAQLCAKKLYECSPSDYKFPRICGMLQMDWREYIQKTRRRWGGKTWRLAQPVIIFINGRPIGSDTEFACYINQFFLINLTSNLEYYQTLISESTKEIIEKTKRVYVYLTLAIENVTIGSLVFMLYSDLLPLTCRHFLNICTEKKEGGDDYRDMSYENTRVHRIVRNGWIQCGDVACSRNNESPANVPTLIDESYCIPHNRRGVLSMANDGKHSIKDQFIVSLKPNPWMNRHYVAFGQLMAGAKTLEAIESVPTYYESPIKEIRISRCGEYLFGSGPSLETEADISLHRSQQSLREMEEESTMCYECSCENEYGTSWPDNGHGKTDVYDTESIVLIEQYLDKLCCTSEHCLGINTCGDKQTDSQSTKLNYDEVGTGDICKLLSTVKSDPLREEEELECICEISKIILTYILGHENTDVCLQHISTDSRLMIKKIVETAYKITIALIRRARKNRTSSNLDGSMSLRIKKSLKKQCDDPALIMKFETLLQEILNTTVLYLTHSNNTRNDPEICPSRR